MSMSDEELKQAIRGQREIGVGDLCKYTNDDGAVANRFELGMNVVIETVRNERTRPYVATRTNGTGKAFFEKRNVELIAKAGDWS